MRTGQSVNLAPPNSAIVHFGGGVGHVPGQFDQHHGIAVDSKGNVYIAENRGKRIQNFKIAGQ